MKLTVISFKECWRAPDGRWEAPGGFPVQMSAICGLFEQSRLVVIEGPPRAGGTRLPEQAEVVPLPRLEGSNLRRKLGVLGQLPRLLPVLRRQIAWADAVHTPLPGDVPLLGLILALLARKRVITRYGGAWSGSGKATAASRFTKWLLRRFAGGRNVMLVSGLGSDDNPPAPGMHWLFTTAIREAEVHSLQPDLDRSAHQPLRLAYAGRLSGEKGLLGLLRALGTVERRRSQPEPLIHLTLIGDGPQRARLDEEIAAQGLKEQVVFTGQLARPDLFAEFARADAFVLPSLTEGFSKARTDAMMAGLPVLTTEVGFGRETIGADGERGWVVPAGDEAALAAALEKLACGEIDWPPMRRRCRAFAEQLTLEKWQARIAEICAAQWGATIEEGKLTV